MQARAILWVAAGILIGLAGAFLILPQARDRLFPAPQSSVSGKALIGGPFSLVDADGRRVTDESFRGRYMLVFFGYTSCPDICPAGLQLISAALDKLGAKADKLTPIFITLDPERDAKDRVGAYVKNFSARLVGLTGTPEEIAQVAKEYRVYYKKVPAEGGAPGAYSLDHSSIIYLMDPNGEYVAHFTPSTQVDELTARLDKIL